LTRQASKRQFVEHICQRVAGIGQIYFPKPY